MKKVVSTINLSRSEWLQYRKMGIGGSDAGAICGLNPYTSAISVYLDKINPDSEVVDNEAMRQGRDLENYVAERFIQETGLKVRKANVMYAHDQFPFMLANVDRMIIGEAAGLECKTTNVLNADKWKDGEVPAHYQIQCHHYMAVTGAKAWYIAVVILGKEFKYVRIERDEDIISNLITIEADFWNNHVLKGVMPDPDGSRAADDIINSYFKTAGTESILLEGYEDRLKRREELSGLMDRIDREKKMIEQEIKLAMAEAETAYCENYQVDWKNVSSVRLDVDRIKTEQPDIYRSYCKQAQSRRFSVRAA
ncbi:putative phage-type endonuclease [Anaerotaenia torta]|uniref:YqaJ viral recombinase family nuclease n=1 Tax=Anaerotaenia torta TaxID=433293 RepID=UPI003D1C0285